MKPRFSIQSFLIYSLMTIFIPLNMAGQNIDFADAKVKALCVANWDTNGDGELSIDEAASVTSLGKVFRDNMEITTFEELQYFTGLTSINFWAFHNCYYLKSISIPSSVTLIDQGAFYGCNRLTSVYIPNDVRSIEYEAFYFCSNLTSISIPNSMEAIGGKAFYGCSLTSITIPNSLKSIGFDAFYGCSLTSVTIPNSVTEIGNAFSGCPNLTSIVVDSGNAKYDSRDGCNAIIETATNTLVGGCTKTIIPNSVTSIGSYAFSGCARLTSITIPNSVTSIGDCAFEGCAFTSIVIPNSVTCIGSAPFSNCGELSFIEVENGNAKYDSRDECNAIIETATNTLVVGCKGTLIPNTVNSIGTEAFVDCTGLTSITIPNNITSIGEGAFSGCNHLLSILIPSSVTSIGNYAFGSCSILSSVRVEWIVPIPINDNIIFSHFGGTPSQFNGILYVPENTQSAYEASSGWNRFNKIIEYGKADVIYFEDMAVMDLCVANWDANKDGMLSEDEAAAVTDLGSTFKNNRDIISFNELQYFTGLTSIDASFFRCANLNSISIPCNVTSIISGFRYCSSLSSVTIPNSVISIDGSFFECSDLTSITIPNSVTSIGSTTFSGCSHLTSIMIPNSVTSIGEKAFYGCSSLTSVIIPSSVTEIGDYAFQRCESLATITIPNSVKTIGDFAFDYCRNLTTVIIPNSVRTIGVNPFRNCHSLISIVVEDGNEYYDSREGCNAIIKTYSNALISGCKNTIIPNSVTSIDDYSFYGCSGLTSVTIPNSVTSIDSYAFQRCTNLTFVNIGGGVMSIDDRAFLDCNSFEHLVVNCPTIGTWFKGYTSIRTIIIGDDVNSIGNYAFYGCSGLTSVTIPSSVISIGSNPFAGCSNLCSIIVDGGNSKYDSREDCNAIVETSTNTLITGCKNTIIPNSVTSIGNYSFYGCSGLASVTIPNSVTSIGDYSFYGCSGLASVTIPNSVTYIGWYAFSNCTCLESVLVELKEPLSLSPTVFEDSPSLTLYVPGRTKVLYELAEVWKDFKEIVEVWKGELMLVDGQDYDNSEEKEIRKLEYSRIFKNTNWQAWYVPFELELTNDLLEHFSFAKFAGTYTEEDGSFYITVARMKEGDVVKANTPYVVQAKVADKTNPQVITQTNVILKAAEENSFYVLSAEKKITFRGNYKHRTVTEDDENWYALSGGLYSRQLPGNTIAPFRCFFTIEDREDNPYPSSHNPSTVKLMVLGEDETNVENMRDNSLDNQAPIIYDLQGRKITNQTSKPGIYIINGKKIFVK